MGQDVGRGGAAVPMPGGAGAKRRMAGTVLSDGAIDCCSACRNHFDVGMTNSAPLAVLSGQRCMIDFWRV